MRWAGYVAHEGGRRGAYRVLVGKPEGRRPFERSRNGYKYSLKKDLQEVGCEVLDWTDLAQDKDRRRL